MDILTFTLYAFWIVVLVSVVVTCAAACVNNMLYERAVRRLDPARLAARKAEYRAAWWFFALCGLLFLFLALVPR